MSKLVINWDIDGCIRNFIDSLERVYKRIYPDHVIKPQGESWELQSRFPMFKGNIDSFIYGGYTWEIFAEAKPYPFAIEMLSEMKKMGHVVQLVTANVGTPLIATATWITKWRVPHDSVHFTHAKERVTGDILFDDSADNLEACKDNIWAVCVNRPWNQEWEGDRVFSCEEALSMVRKA